MGLKVSTTCEVTFGDKHPAIGTLQGDVHDGIAQMFKVIEYARMMVGTKAIEDLELPEDPVGEYIRIGAEWFKVVGVMEKRGELLGFSQDNLVLIPFDVGRAMTGNDVQPRMSISFTAESLEDVEALKF